MDPAHPTFTLPSSKMGTTSLLRLLTITSAALHALALVPISSTDDQTREAAVVDLGYAKYRGVLSSDTGVTNYLGVRLAAAPEGDLRWRAPQPPTPAEGIQDASIQPPLCHQGTLGGAPTSPWLASDMKLLEVLRRQEQTFSLSEDCLFLNVHVPRSENKNKNGKHLPVVVWFHGGGYFAGNAGAYDGADLFRLSKQRVITVMLQHRLGFFGFLAGKQVKDGGHLNAGLHESIPHKFRPLEADCCRTA